MTFFTMLFCVMAFSEYNPFFSSTKGGGANALVGRKVGVCPSGAISIPQFLQSTKKILIKMVFFQSPQISQIIRVMYLQQNTADCTVLFSPSNTKNSKFRYIS